MDEARLTSLRLPYGTDSARWVDISVDGKMIRALQGEPLVSALLAEGLMTIRHTFKTGSPRGMFCGMGTCFECLVKVNGTGFVRACMTRVEPGLVVETGEHER